MAINEKLSNPVAIRCATVVRAGSAGILISMVKMLDIPIDHAIGTPIAINIKKLSTKMITSIL